MILITYYIASVSNQNSGGVKVWTKSIPSSPVKMIKVRYSIFVPILSRVSKVEIFLLTLFIGVSGFNNFITILHIINYIADLMNQVS